MKIENSLFAAEMPGAARGVSQNRTDQASFGELLAKAVGEECGEDRQLGCQPVGEVASAQAPAQGDSAAPPWWSELNALLDSLESYAQGLGNPARSLKELEPLARELEARADQLQQGLSQGGLGGLAGLAQEVLAQARVEGIKFRRGDYI